MNVRMRSMSVLPVVLPFFLVAALTHSLSLAAVAQNRAQKESASFKNVEETVSKLLSVPVYTVSDEKLLNEAGDGAALAITRIVSEREMNSPDTGRRILLILHLAFEAPNPSSSGTTRPRRQHCVCSTSWSIRITGGSPT